MKSVPWFRRTRCIFIDEGVVEKDEYCYCDYKFPRACWRNVKLMIRLLIVIMMMFYVMISEKKIDCQNSPRSYFYFVSLFLAEATEDLLGILSYHDKNQSKPFLELYSPTLFEY